MPRATRTFLTDLAELQYQIARSDQFARIERDFRLGEKDDQSVQETVVELLELGRCRFHGDHGPEEWSWSLDDSELATLANRLYREQLGGQ